MWFLKRWHVHLLGAVDNVKAVIITGVLRLAVLDDARVRVDAPKRLMVVVGARSSKWTLPSLI